jgi:hypothetical protein
MSASGVVNRRPSVISPSSTSRAYEFVSELAVALGIAVLSALQVLVSLAADLVNPAIVFVWLIHHGVPKTKMRTGKDNGRRCPFYVITGRPDYDAP